jgi:hypothetical protein
METLQDLMIYAKSCDNLWLLSKLTTLEFEIKLEIIEQTSKKR